MSKAERVEISFIRRLCSHLPETEIEAAEDNFRQVVGILTRIARRQLVEQSTQADSTRRDLDSTIRKELRAPTS